MSYADVKKIILEGKSAVSDPTINYIVGQTGSGKSTLINNILHSQNNNCVIIDNDLWRSFYPNYLDLIKKFKTDELPEIITAMKEWRNELIEEISSKKYNIIMHTSLTNVNEFLQQVEILRQQGYKCTMSVIACHEYYSRIRSCFRYMLSTIRQRIWTICNRP